MKVGDSTTVFLPTGQQRVKVVGLVAVRERQGQPRRRVVRLFTTESAQKLLHVNGYSDLVVAANDGVSQDQLRTRIAAALPSGTEAITGTQLADEQASDIQEGLGFLNTFLLVFAAVALFVGAFIIFNTFSILVAQRTRELALMRALGASKGQVTRSVLLEAVVVGGIASAIGLGAGVGVAIGLQALFGAFGAGLPSASPVIELRTVIARVRGRHRHHRGGGADAGAAGGEGAAGGGDAGRGDRGPAAGQADHRRRDPRGRRRGGDDLRPDRQRAGACSGSARCWRSSAWRCSRRW